MTMNMPLALTYLNEDALLHIDMLEAVRREKGELLFAAKEGVLLRHAAADAYMMSAKDEYTARSMLNLIPRADLFVAHQTFTIPLVEEALHLHASLACVQAVYLGREPVAVQRQHLAIEMLDHTHLPFVAQWYSHQLDPEYLLEQLNAGVMYGAYVEGALAGFIGEHAEGSIGMLEVLPQFQRCGIGEALEAFQTNRHLAEGYVPFGQVVEGNTASLKLQEKLGYTLSEGRIYWMK